MAGDTPKQTPEQEDDTPEMEPPLLQDSAAATSHPLLLPSSPPLPDSSSAPLPADAASKRQRRPNVRLNEIGSESSLANVVEYLLKRKDHPSVVAAKRGRPPKLASPGKLPKKTKHLPKFNSDDIAGVGGEYDDDGVNVGDAQGGPYGDGSEPEIKKPSESLKLHVKGRNRKTGNSASIHAAATAMAKHAKRPKVIFPRAEGNGNNWMHKTADGFLEAADGAVYACSDTDKHVRSPSPNAQPPMFSFDSDSPLDLKKEQAAPKRRKKQGISLKLPRATERMHKDGPLEEKEEPSSSALQELRMQGPVWERGLPPLDEKVREWMQKIGLEKYATIFQHHEVGDDVVPLLTMDDLKEMGIQAVGARRKFYHEITKRRQSMMLITIDSLAEEK